MIFFSEGRFCISKLCRPWWNAALCGISSESSLFAMCLCKGFLSQCSAMSAFLRHLTHKISKCPQWDIVPWNLHRFLNLFIICPLFCQHCSTIFWGHGSFFPSYKFSWQNTAVYKGLKNCFSCSFSFTYFRLGFQNGLLIFDMKQRMVIFLHLSVYELQQTGLFIGWR